MWRTSFVSLLPSVKRRVLSGAAMLINAFSAENLTLLSRNASYRFRKALEGSPVPPARLIRLVAGGTDVDWYMQSGKLAVSSMLNVLKRHKVDFGDFQAVLDFGCGCGRVIQHWRTGSPTQLYGCDYNPELIRWASRNLPFARFDVNSLSPALPYSDGQFSFVYGLSVFTHLAESLQGPWMKELSRIVQPEGYLLVSVHGSHYLEIMNLDEQCEFRAGRIVVRESDDSGSNICAAFHPEEYVREELAKEWEVVDFVPTGATGNPYQDVYLMRKP